jgi:hypothetical protein
MIPSRLPDLTFAIVKVLPAKPRRCALCGAEYDAI